MFDEAQSRSKVGGRSGANNGDESWLQHPRRCGERQAAAHKIQMVLRPPVVMAHYTAATCASILGEPGDIAGLLPQAGAALNARYFDSVSAAGSHSVNKLVSNVYVYRKGRSGPDAISC